MTKEIKEIIDEAKEIASKRTDSNILEECYVEIYDVPSNIILKFNDYKYNPNDSDIVGKELPIISKKLGHDFLNEIVYHNSSAVAKVMHRVGKEKLKDELYSKFIKEQLSI